MLNKKIIAICLLAILSFISTQFTPIPHKPLSLDLNHTKRSENTLNLTFTAEHYGKPISIYRGYAFVFYFPDGTISDSDQTPYCNIDNDGDIGAFISSLDTVNSRVICEYDSNEETFRDGRLLNMNVPTKVSLSGFNLNNTFYNKFRFGLFTARENGVLLIQTPAFKSFALYQDYSTMPATNSYVVSKEAYINNLTESLSCPTAPCLNKLYPWSEFSLSLKVEVNKLIYPEEAYLVFKFNTLANYEDIVPKSLDVESTEVEADNSVKDKTLYTRLTSSSGSNKLSLEYLGDNTFAIRDISNFRSEGLANLVPGRSFWLTFTGFSTNQHVGNPAITSVNIFVLWKNTSSYLSYSSLPLSSISTISKLNFRTANEASLDVQSSFAENMEGSTMNIYENGMFQIVFQIRVPKSEAGRLIITSLNNTTRVFSFISSTCDFSLSGFDKNVIGTRKKCIPLYSSTNGLERSITSTSSESAFYINLNASLITSQDIKFTVWGFANMCNPDILYGSKMSYGNILGNTVGTPLVFKLQLEINKVVYAEESSFTSRIKCIKNIRDRELKGFMRFYKPSSPTYKSVDLTSNPIVQLVGQPELNTDKDYILYEEVGDWEPMIGSTPTVNVNSITNNLTISNFPVPDNSKASFQNLTSPANNINSNYFGISFKIAEVVGDAEDNSIDYYVPLPYTQKITYDSNSLLENKYSAALEPKEGRYTLTIPSLVAEQVKDTNNEGCNLVSFSEERNSKRKYSAFKSTSNNLNYKMTLTSNSITTSNVNLKDGLQQDMLLYEEKEFYETNIHTTCYKFKDYKNFQIKNMYTAVSFYLKYERVFNFSLYENRVIRFFKFFNSSSGFRKDNKIDRPENPINYFKYYSVDVMDSFSSNKLCLLHIDEAFTNVALNHNTLLINLLNARLPFIGEGNPTNYYPVSQLKSSANVVPLYTEAPNNMITDRGAYNDFNQQLNGYYDFEYDSYMTPFLGSSLIISGFSSVQGISEENEIYIPLYCGLKAYLTVQSFNIQGNGDIDKDSNIYYTFNTEFKVKLFDNHNPLGLPDSNTSFTNVSLRFPDYRTIVTGTATNNYLTVNSGGDVSNFFTSILLTKNVDSLNLPSAVSNNVYFNQKLILGNTSSFSINGQTYQNIYFMKPLTNTSTEELNGKLITFLRRIPITNTSGEVLVQGIGSKVFSTVNKKVYYSNNDFKNDIVVKNSKKISYPKNDNSAITITSLEPIGKIYKSDDGQQFTITVRIYSDLEVSGASLRIHSPSNFNTRTLCVYTDNPRDNDCVRVSEGAFRCSGIKLLPSYNTVRISCFNVSIGSNGIFSLSTQTSISQSDYIEENMTSVFTTNYLNDDLKSAVEAVVPKVTRYSCVQGQQIGALANCYLQINLGRPLRINQTIILNGAVNNLYIPGTTPTCHYMLTDEDTNLDNINFYGVSGKANSFVNTCRISNSLGEGHSITLNTRNYVPKGLITFPSNILIRISPVYVINLNLFKYSIQTYLGSDVNSVIAAPAKEDNLRLNFPDITPKIDSSLIELIPSALPGLCNLSSVFPRIQAQTGQMTFSINMKGTSKNLEEINKNNNANKVFNEVSIFLDPTIYMRNPMILCEFKSSNLPCDWNEQGYLNIRFGYSLTEDLYEIIVKGILIPHVTKNSNNADFLCSVNYYYLDSREQLYVGRGTYLESEYTYSPENAGNLIFYNPPKGYVSNTTPGKTADYSFRFTPDFTFGFTSTAQKFEAKGNSNPAILVHFPSYYNFSGLTSPLEVSLKRTYYKTDSNKAEETVTEEKNISATASAKYNFVIIQLKENPFTTPENLAYIDLTILNLPNPDSAVLSSAETSITILSELSSPNLILYTYLNLNNNVTGVQVNDEFNNYYLSPIFNYNEQLDKMALIEFEKSEISIKTGRYINFNATVKSTIANESTDFSLDSGIFQSLENSPIKLDTGRKRSGTIRIGTSCKTIYGSYWLTFSISNTDGFYKVAPVRVNVSTVKNNIEPIILNNTRTSSDMSTFKLAPGGITTIFATVKNPPFENVNFTITTPSDQVNNGSFKILINKLNIQAKSSWSYITYSITNETPTVQRHNLSIDNACYGFGSVIDPPSSRTISFNIEGTLADLTGIKLIDKFRYANEARDPVNSIKLVFKSPIPNTKLSCALICKEADFPSKSQIESEYALKVNNRLARYYQNSFYTDSDVIISFENLQRGSFYKLGCYYANFGVVQAFVFNFTEIIPANIDETIKIPLYISDVSPNKFVRFDFKESQSKEFYYRLLTVTQNYANVNSFGANIVVSDSEGLTLKGYEVESRITCESLTAESDFPSDPNQQERNTQNLRYLQEDILTNENTENLVDTNTEENLVDMESDQYSESYWLIFKQALDDPVNTNTPDIISAYIESVNTVEELGKLINTDTVKLLGDFKIAEIVEINMNASQFELKSFSYTPTTFNTTLSFIPEGPVEIQCDWKLHRINETNVNEMNLITPKITEDEIKDCTENTNCGIITFSPNNTNTTYLEVQVEYKVDGTYFLGFFCENLVPQSDNDILFDRLAIIVSGNKSDDQSTSDTQIIIDCNGNPSNNTDLNCYSNIYSVAYAALILFLIITLLDA